MFGLAPYNSNGALMATTGFMLTPLASALNRVGYTVSRDEDMPSIAPAEPSSEWNAWLTSGYVGDFLGWAGNQLAEVGRDLFPGLSISERQRRMEISKEELKRLLTESLLEEDEEIDAKIREVLEIYLRQGIALVNREALEHEIWKDELLSLEAFSKRAGRAEVAGVFAESVAQVDLLLFRIAEKDNKDERQQEFFSHAHQVSAYNPSAAEADFPDTFDVGILTSSSNPEGFKIADSAMNGCFGYSVSGAGDVNGDGFADLIVGARGENSFEGVSYVVFGQAAAFSASFDVGILTSSSNPRGFKMADYATSGNFGISVSGAGDVNGDGFADLIVGAYGENGNKGASYVVFGQEAAFPNAFDVGILTSTSNPRGFKMTDSATNGYFGRSVSGAGDVNGDGFADLIVGAYGENGNKGASYVVFGQEAAFPNAFDVGILTSSSNPRGFKMSDFATYGNFGRSVSGAGDVNGDGYADLVVGALGENSSNGASYVVFGQSAAFPANFDVEILTSSSNPRGFKMSDSVTSGCFGHSVSGAGDVNGDGYADLIVGAYSENSSNGASYVVFGQAAAFPASFHVGVLTSFSNPRGFKMTDSATSEYLYFGYSVSGAGDVNGDGYADLIVGARGENGNKGASYVVFGQAAAFPASFDVGILASSSNPRGFKMTDSATNGHFGISVSAAGDVNKDGYADLIVGAVGENSAKGASYVVFGESAISPSPTPSPTPASISVPLYPSVFNTNQLNGKQGFTILGVNAGDTMGWSVSDAGDINNDGISDMIIGAKSTTVADIPDSGTAYVVFGQQKQFTSPTISISKLTGKNGFSFSIVGLPRNTELGYAVSYAGDVNKDGIADVMIGVPYSSVHSYNDQAGTAYVLFGSHNIFPAMYNISALDGSNGFSVKGEAAGDLLGYSVSTAGDVNRDGIEDMLIGAPQATANGEYQSGKVYVIFGQHENFPAVINVTSLGQAQPGFMVYGETEFDKAGQSVAAAGDINADGIADFVIGAPEALVGSNLSAAGKAYVIFGNRNGFLQTLNTTALNGQNGFSVNGISSLDNLGAAVSSAGDVNRDGIADLLIGAPHATVGTGTPTTGAAYIIFGRSGAFAASITPDSLDGDNGCALIGYASGDQTGASVAGVGDFNVDGVDDILIGAPKASAAGQGRAGKGYLFFGHRGNYPATINLASLDGNTGMTIEGGSTGDEAGFSVSGAGDINADGAPDLLLGAPGLDNNGAGKSHVLLGGISFFSAKPLPRMLSSDGNRETSIPHKMN